MNPEKQKLKVSIYLITIFTTLIAAIESFPFVPYAPFFFIYGISALIFSYIYRYLFSSSITISYIQYFKFTVRGLTFGILYICFFTVMVWMILKSTNLEQSLKWNVLLIYRQIYQANTLAPFLKNLYTFLFIVLWAGIVEELFYRGAIFKGLQKDQGVLKAAIISSFFFGIRHSAQLFYISPYPIGAGVIYFFFSFFAGLLLVFLFQSSNSILPCIFTHTGINFLGFPILLYIFNQGQ